MWSEVQSDFRAALSDPERTTPSTLRGFNVYRNNVAVSLKAALGETFPVVKLLVGEDFFDAMAGVFWRLSPPQSPILAQWGDDFPDFIQSFEPAQSLPFLADVARLEWAWLQAYHGEDKTALSIDVLSSLDEAALATHRLDLHPTLQVMTSNWPICAIWQAHQKDDIQLNFEIAQGPEEDVLVLRPHLDVLVSPLDEPEKILIKSCQHGLSISAALQAISDGADPSTPLVTLFQRGAVVGVTPINTQGDSR